MSRLPIHPLADRRRRRCVCIDSGHIGGNGHGSPLGGGEVRTASAGFQLATGAGFPDTSDYVVRSHWCPWLGIGRDRPQREGLDWTEYQRMVGQWRRVCGYMLGDYYPLTSYSLENTVWMAWQFDRPDLGEGMVQMFRRAESPYESARFLLRGLEPDAQYMLTDLDTGHTEQLAGHRLMKEGLAITIQQRPSAPVVLYRKVR